VGGGSWSGDFNFGVDTNNPLDTNFAYANALLGNINSYTETNGYADVRGQRPSAEAYVQDTWKPLRNLTVEPGRMVIEIRSGGMDKGMAVRRLVEEYDAGAILFVGDDLGDVPAFEAVADLRAQGVPGLLVASGSDEQSALRDLADLEVEGPDGVMAFLRRLTADLSAAAS